MTCSKLNWILGCRLLLFLVMAGIISGASGCATRPLVMKTPPKAEELVQRLELHEKAIDSFLAMGDLTISSSKTYLRAELIVIGRYPDTLRWEVSSTFGTPLLYMVAKEEDVTAVSFDKKSYYRSYTLSPYLPVSGLTAKDVSHILLGMPILLEFTRSSSSYDPELDAWVLDLDNPKLKLKEQILLRADDSTPISLSLSHYQSEDAFRVAFSDFFSVATSPGFESKYPRTITITTQEQDSTIKINVKELQFDVPIKDALFKLRKPAGFKEVLLEGK
ncbi:MAG: hypothetical protein HQK60_14605 [Deltaproteobacteria bacterium]|nr:hypothetical protein [Deltaproteobacteria bacterium]